MKYLQVIIIFLIPLILGQYIENERKINLEDIEDDNVLSEKLSNENDPLITQSTQHLRPPSILAVNPYLTSHQSSGGIIYGTPTTENEIHYTQSLHDNQKYQHHHHQHHPHQVQYFTQHQSPELLAEQNYNRQVYGTPAAVHEQHDPTYTYTTLASRQSLLKPIIPTIATYLQPHQQQQQQPEHHQQQFLYLPHGRSLNHRPQELQQVVGGIQYVTHPPTPSVIYTHDGQEIDNEDKIPNDQIIYHHHHSQPQQIPGSGATYLQYIPYVTRGSNNGQQYIIMAPIPAGYAQQTAITKPLLSYSHSAAPQQVVQYDVPQAPNRIVGGIQYVTNNEIENVPVSVQPHPHPVQIPYAAGYANTLQKRPSQLYRLPNTQQHQPNSNYLTTYTDQQEDDEENSQHNGPEEEKETTRLNPQLQPEENHEDNFEPIKQVISYSPKVQDIQYATPNSVSDNHNSDLEKSKQQQYAPQHPQLQQSPAPTSIPAKNNHYFTPNRFSSFQSTTATPAISQRYYAAQKHITSTIKSNDQQQQQHDHPTSSNQSWSNKVMPLQYQQYEPRYSTSTPVSITNTFGIQQYGSTTTTNPLKVQSNINTPSAPAFRSPIPKYYIPTPKTLQSTHRSSTATIPITTNEQKHFTAKQQYQQTQQQQQQQQSYEIQSTPKPLTLPKFIQANQQHQQPIKNNNDHQTDTQLFTNNRQPKSLLESYIPSWVVVENQNKERTQQQHQNGINNNYNTISFSVPHNQINGNHLKRSPTIATTKLIKI